MDICLTDYIHFSLEVSHNFSLEVFHGWNDWDEWRWSYFAANRDK